MTASSHTLQFYVYLEKRKEEAEIDREGGERKE